MNSFLYTEPNDEEKLPLGQFHRGTEALYDEYHIAPLEESDPIGVSQKPQWGWRKFISRTVFPWLNKSVDERNYDTAVRVLNEPLKRTGIIAVTSHKGGVGKTTLSVVYANIIAQIRKTGKLLIIEATPGGTLAQRITTSSTALQNSRALQDRIDELRKQNIEITLPEALSFTVHNKNRITLLAWDPNPIRKRITPEELNDLITLFSREYDIIIIDCDPTVNSDLTKVAISRAEAIIPISDNDTSGLKGLISYLGWQKYFFPEKSDCTQPIINYRNLATTFDPIAAQMNLKKRGFGKIIFNPSDPHLAKGGIIDLQSLSKIQKRKFVKQAAHIFQFLPLSNKKP